MKFAKIRITDILTEGPNAGRFSFSFEPEIKELADSIKKVGLVNPPILRKSEGGFEVVCGFRRVLACKSLKTSEIEAMVGEMNDLTDEKCLWFSLIDSSESSRMSPVERASALNKFHKHGYDAARLAGEVAPLLGLPSSKKYVENHLGLMSLDREILLGVHDGSFGVEQAFCLQQLEADSRAPVFRILRTCRANLNETRELVSLIPDVAAIKGSSVPGYIAGEISPIIEDESQSPRKKFGQIRDRLLRARYPRLAEAESAFDAMVKRMKLEKLCRVTAPKNFEGSDITLTIKAKNENHLKGILMKLFAEDVERGFEELFSILRGNDIS